MAGNGNPILDEIDQLSPGAKAALAAAHQTMSAQLTAPGNPAIAAAKASAAVPPAPEPAPGPNPLAKPMGAGLPAIPSLPGSSGPSGFAFSRTGKVAPLGNTPVPQQGTTAGDTLERQRLLATGPGVNQIKNGGVRGLAKVGDIIGGLVAPGLMARIPGTTAHHDVLVNRNAGNLTADISNEEKQAQTKEAGAKTDLEAAQAANLPLEYQRQLDQIHAGLAENGLQMDEGGNITPLSVEQLSPEVRAKLYGEWSPVPENPGWEVNKQSGQFRVAPGAGDVGPLSAKLTQSQPIMGPDNQPHTYMIDARGNKVTDEGVHYERPITVNAGQSEADKMGARLAKPYQAAVTAGQNQLEKMDEAMQLVQGNAEAQALGIPKTLTALVSGPATGVRITQPELNAIAKARGIQGDFEGALRKMEGNGPLTKQQQQQIVQVIQDAKTRLQEKINIHNQALDAINGASSREQVVEADKTARKQLGDLEKYGHYTGETVTVNGKEVVIKKIDPDGTFEY